MELQAALQAAVKRVFQRCDLQLVQFPSEYKDTVSKCGFISTFMISRFATAEGYDEEKAFTHLLTTYGARRKANETKRSNNVRTAQEGVQQGESTKRPKIVDNNDSTDQLNNNNNNNINNNNNNNADGLEWCCCGCSILPRVESHANFHICNHTGKRMYGSFCWHGSDTTNDDFDMNSPKNVCTTCFRNNNNNYDTDIMRTHAIDVDDILHHDGGGAILQNGDDNNGDNDNDGDDDGDDDENNIALEDAKLLGTEEEQHLKLVIQLSKCATAKKLHESIKKYVLDFDEKSSLQTDLEVVQTSTTMSVIHKLLFELIAVKADSKVPPNGMNAEQKKNCYEIKAQEVYNHMLMIEADREILIALSPPSETVDFPKGFKSYFDKRKANTHQTFLDTRKSVVNYILPLLPKTLPSGVNLRKWHWFIRKCVFYRVKSKDKARQSVEKKYRKREMARLNIKKGDKAALKAIEFDCKVHREDIEAKQLTYQVHQYYFPDGWLAFICGAHPTLLGPDKILKCFTKLGSDDASASVAPGLFAIAQMGEEDRPPLPSKGARRNFANSQKLATPDSRTSSLSPDDSRTHVHIIQHQSEVESDYRLYYNKWLMQAIDFDSQITELPKTSENEFKLKMLKRAKNNAVQAMKDLERDHPDLSLEEEF
jgi:hypothetical protein